MYSSPLSPELLRAGGGPSCLALVEARLAVASSVSASGVAGRRGRGNAHARVERLCVELELAQPLERVVSKRDGAVLAADDVRADHAGTLRARGQDQRGLEAAGTRKVCGTFLSKRNAQPSTQTCPRSQSLTRCLESDGRMSRSSMVTLQSVDESNSALAINTRGREGTHSCPAGRR